MDNNSRQENDFLEQREDVLEKLHTFQAPYEGLESLFSPFENYTTRAARATFKDGRMLAELRDDAAIINLLSGSYSSLELIRHSVRKDMTVHAVDNTAAVVDAYRRRRSGEGLFVDPSVPSRALSHRRKPDRLVTIDSDNVHIVRDLSNQKWDLEAVLIEVDQSSLMSLISNYQQVIRRGGPDLPMAETLQLLDTLIEDARRLCIRSPVLFRMSTRKLIVASKNTRYGVDDGVMFKTLTTSTGIRNILELSASYYNSLPDSIQGSSERQQVRAEVRPRFLQMVVLLLALLNDNDLRQLEAFLETTFRIKADRQNLELLILKVLPLSSINSRIFLHALVTAVDGPLVRPSQHEDDQREIWKAFLGHILQLGYVVPGSIDEVCGPDHSWIITWPGDGLKDTNIFRNLQYNGESRTINEIPRVDLNPEFAAGAELTVILANGVRFVIASADLENIIRMSPGRYSVNEARSGGRSLDLDIDDTWSILPHRSTSVVLFDSVFRPGRSKYDDSTLAEIRGCGRLTYHCARLNGECLAVTYKIDGRAIGRRELLRLLQGDLSKIDVMVKAVQTTLSTAYDGRKTSQNIASTLFRLQEELAAVNCYVEEANRRKMQMLRYEASLHTEPVAKVLYQVGARDTQIALWREYCMWHQANENVLYVDSERRMVKDVRWTEEQTLVVTFHDVPHMQYFATPLSKVSESEIGEQLKIGDHVLLCGQYMCIVEQSGESYQPTGLAPGDEAIWRKNLQVPIRQRRPVANNVLNYDSQPPPPQQRRVPQSLRPGSHQQRSFAIRNPTIPELDTEAVYSEARAQQQAFTHAQQQRQQYQHQRYYAIAQDQSQTPVQSSPSSHNSTGSPGSANSDSTSSSDYSQPAASPTSRPRAPTNSTYRPSQSHQARVLLISNHHSTTRPTHRGKRKHLNSNTNVLHHPLNSNHPNSVSPNTSDPKPPSNSTSSKTPQTRTSPDRWRWWSTGYESQVLIPGALRRPEVRIAGPGQGGSGAIYDRM
ncbi:uncharacterized protein AB675_6973 [Cyphellophora attinorum]|uniref:Uncharacterized protein n=1 Tax=Cyphellophora attinorum TaxID=1664694 RepID=A0A0N0NQA0_9EURO|nr:uncharacterized protein AB675_6973 [Phialophora attinorum]KPI43459.1 hypothetical protein AB675_6973 [Phialophora attinorum]